MRDREKTASPVQLTTSRIGNHTRLIHTLLEVLTIQTNNHLGLFEVNNGVLYFLDFVEDIYKMVNSVLVSILNPNHTYFPLLQLSYTNHPAVIV